MPWQDMIMKVCFFFSVLVFCCFTMFKIKIQSDKGIMISGQICAF